VAVLSFALVVPGVLWVFSWENCQSIFRKNTQMFSERKQNE